MPDWTPHVRPRLSSLRLSATRENEIVDELSQHLDDRWRELTAGGASPDEATRLALAEFRDGNVLARYMAPLRAGACARADHAGSARRACVRRSLAGPALCDAYVEEAAGLHPRRRPDPRARAWRERRHLLRHQCRAASAAAISER